MWQMLHKKGPGFFPLASRAHSKMCNVGSIAWWHTEQIWFVAETPDKLFLGVQQLWGILQVRCLCQVQPEWSGATASLLQLTSSSFVERRELLHEILQQAIKCYIRWYIWHLGKDSELSAHLRSRFSDCSTTRTNPNTLTHQNYIIWPPSSDCHQNLCD